MTSFYQATIPSYIKFLNNFSLIIEKAEAWAKENGKTEKEILEARLIEDMLPFTFQVFITLKMAVAIGVDLAEVPVPSSRVPSEYSDFEPLKESWHSLADVRKSIDETVTYLKTIPANATDGKNDKEIILKFPTSGGYKLDAHSFVFDYSISNFHFHYTTAYDILRSMGVQIGKGDYIKGVLINKI